MKSMYTLYGAENSPQHDKFWKYLAFIYCM